MASRSSTEPSARRSPTSASPSSVTTSCGVPCTILTPMAAIFSSSSTGSSTPSRTTRVTSSESWRKSSPWWPAIGVVPEDGDPLVADLPAVAVGAVQHVPAPPLGEPGHVGQLVDHAAGDQDASGGDASTALGGDEEGARFAGQAHDAVVEHLDAVRRHLGAADLEQLERGDALAPEVVVGVVGRGVAGLAGIDHQHRAPGPAEGHRTAQAGHAATDHHHVESHVIAHVVHGQRISRS